MSSAGGTCALCLEPQPDALQQTLLLNHNNNVLVYIHNSSSITSSPHCLEHHIMLLCASRGETQNTSNLTNISAHLFMEAVSARQDAGVYWFHVFMADDTWILSVQLQQTHTHTHI